jgi:hypothetical protein
MVLPELVEPEVLALPDGEAVPLLPVPALSNPRIEYLDEAKWQGKPLYVAVARAYSGQN